MEYGNAAVRVGWNCELGVGARAGDLGYDLLGAIRARETHAKTVGEQLVTDA